MLDLNYKQIQHNILIFVKIIKCKNNQFIDWKKNYKNGNSREQQLLYSLFLSFLQFILCAYYICIIF